jgi:hypothetical protein
MGMERGGRRGSWRNNPDDDPESVHSENGSHIFLRDVGIHRTTRRHNPWTTVNTFTAVRTTNHYFNNAHHLNFISEMDKFENYVLNVEFLSNCCGYTKLLLVNLKGRDNFGDEGLRGRIKKTELEEVEFQGVCWVHLSE